MKSVAMVAFTGGLDSTWCLYNVLRNDKHTEVYVIQANVGGHYQQLILELFARRQMLNELKILFPNKTIKEIVCPTPTMYINQGGRGGSYVQLVQPINIYNAFLRCTTKLPGGMNYVDCITGWHKNDVFEGDCNEGVLKAWLDQYRGIITTMCKSIQPEQNNSVVLTTPAWDKEKLDMWNELPEVLRRHITTAEQPSVDWDDDTNTVLIQTNQTSKKIMKYGRLGITIQSVSRRYDLSTLSDLDIWVIHVNMINGLLPTFMEDAHDVKFYFNDEIKQRLGCATDIGTSPPYGFSGVLCMTGDDLELYIGHYKYTPRRTAHVNPYSFDEIFYGNNTDDTTNQIGV